MATNIDQSNNLMIGNGVTFKGTLNVPKKATIYGTVDGELTAEEIFIGQSGKITGKVTARAIEVEGELHQVIHCRDHLHIRATGKVSGKLEYSQIQIERGGEFRGEMQQVGTTPIYPSANPASPAVSNASATIVSAPTQTVTTNTVSGSTVSAAMAKPPVVGIVPPASNPAPVSASTSSGSNI